MTAEKPNTLHSRASEYVRLYSEIEAAQEHLKALNKRKKEAESALFEAMIYEEAPSVEVRTEDGKARVYPINKLWARKHPDVTEDKLHAALRASGLGDLVKEKVNVQSLSAVVREAAWRGHTATRSARARRFCKRRSNGTTRSGLAAKRGESARS